MNFLSVFKRIISSDDEIRFNDIIEKGVYDLQHNNVSVWSAKPKDLQSAIDTLLRLSDKQRVQFLLAAIKEVHKYFEGRTSYGGSDPAYVRAVTALTLLSHALRTKLRLDEEDVELLVEGFITYKRGSWGDVTGWPIGLLVTAVERSFENELPEKVKKRMESLKGAIQKLNRNDKETVKLIDKIDSYLFRSASGGESVKPTFFLGEDKFATYANEIIKQQPEDEKQTWYNLLQLAQKASGSKPSSKFLERSKALIKELPADKFKRVVKDWFEFVVRLKESVQQHSYTYGNGEVINYQLYDFLTAPNIDAIKGFVWMCCHFHDTHTLKLIASLCERSFKKIPGKGPAAAAIGNACLFTLYKSKGLEGVAHLSRLKFRVKQNNTQSLIAKYLQEAANSEGISVSEIEDLAVDDFDLCDGKREYEIEGYSAILTIEAVGDVNINWFKPDRSTLKSAPSVIKEKHANKLRKIKETAKQIETTLVAQRDRIDRMFRSLREMPWPYFVKHYFTHGLVSNLAKDIIWKFRKGDKETVSIFLHGNWTNLQSEEIEPDESMMVSLWHPAMAGVEEIRAWRKLLVDEQIRQPIKQAFREVYLLTEAEVNTRTYSNRMAAHILKQHQFNSLARTRGWRYSLLGAYDDGRYNEGADLHLAEANLRAEFWVNEVNADNQFNDTGIWNYVATDQVRFVDINTNEPVELVSVSPIIFSEVMRDVDLFVGVASVGNDPTWNDSGGVPAYRDYWQSYSFGELTEIAKTRKEILEGLVPRLKIASVAAVRDKYLIVTGKKRTYKIHIGSTNILMEPNDQYLCIVPDRSKKDGTSNIFLPFEGDAGLSVILSKAILLADDDKITDPSIVSQIDRK